MQSGEVLFDEMPEDQRKAFAAYVFLATLQELPRPDRAAGGVTGGFSQRR